MKISDDQVRRVTECLTTKPMSGLVPAPHQQPDSSLVAVIVDMLCVMPDLRLDRIEHARRMINGNMPDSRELASKLVGRVLSDSLL